MSWQAYVDSSLVGSQQLDKAAIISAAGDSVWATTAGFAVKPQEMKALAAAFASQKDRDTFWGNGVHIAGVKYVTTKNEDRSIYGAQGKEGIVIVKTLQAILIAHHPNNVSTGNAANVVEKLADYLISAKY